MFAYLGASQISTMGGKGHISVLDQRSRFTHIHKGTASDSKCRDPLDEKAFKDNHLAYTVAPSVDQYCN